MLLKQLLDQVSSKQQTDEHARYFRLIVVLNKIDLFDSQVDQDTERYIQEIESLQKSFQIPIFKLSCSTGNGIGSLEDGLIHAINGILESSSSSDNSDSNSEGALITRDRHRFHVKQCCYHLNRFLNLRLPMDAAAEEIRSVSIYYYRPIWGYNHIFTRSFYLFYFLNSDWLCKS